MLLPTMHTRRAETCLYIDQDHGIARLVHVSQAMPKHGLSGGHVVPMLIDDPVL